MTAPRTWASLLGENAREERGLVIVAESFGPLVLTFSDGSTPLPSLIAEPTFEVVRIGARRWRLEAEGRTLGTVALRGSKTWAEWTAEARAQT